MAINTFSYGVNSKAAFKTHTTDFNTGSITAGGTALSAGDGFRMLLGGAPKTSIEYASNDAATGSIAMRGPGVKIRESYGGSFTALAGYNTDALLRMISGHFGAETTGALGGTAAYQHAMTYAVNSAILGNLAFPDGLRLRDSPFTKITAFELNVPEGSIGTITFDVVGKQELVDDSGVNTLANVGTNVTVPAEIAVPWLTLAQAAVRINAESGGAVGSGDLRYPSNIKIRFQRDWKTDRRTPLNAPLIDEPVAGDFGTVGLELTFPIDDTAGDWTWMQAGTRLKADVVFDSGVVADTGYNYLWNFEFPSLEVSTDGLPDMNTADYLNGALMLESKIANSTPTGMAFLLPQLTVQDIITGDHLTSGV